MTQKSENTNIQDNIIVNDIDEDIIDLDLEPIAALNNLNNEDGLQLYFNNISQYKPLSHQEEQDLGILIQQGNKQALRKLILSNLKFVVSIANKYKNMGVPILDLINQGNIGLIEAAKRYNPNHGTKFITYAVWWIRQSIVQALSEQSNTVKMPLKHTTYLYKINSATEKLTKELGRVPSVMEISEATSIDIDDINEVLMASQKELSLDNYINQDESKTFMDSLEDENSNVENALIAKTLKTSIDEIVSTLDPREADIIAKRFGFDGQEPMTLEELGDEMGLSRERIRQIESKALDKLRKKALKKKLNDYLN